MAGDKLKILSVSTSDAMGGAAKAAYRIHSGVRKIGIDSTLFVKDKLTNDDSVTCLRDFCPNGKLFTAFDWIATKIKNKWQHFIWSNYNTNKSTFLSDLRSTRIFGALSASRYDLLHIHWINQRFLPIGILKKIHRPIIWTLHDSWAFCGVCHVPLDCKKYENGCGSCPLLRSGSPNDISHRIAKRKNRIYKNLDLHIVCPSRWLANCAGNSYLLKNKDIRVIPNCIETDLFCPGDRNEACSQWGLDIVKHYLVFGAVNAFSDKNKGFDYLIEAIRILSDESKIRDVELLIFGDDSPLPDIGHAINVHSLGKIIDPASLANLYRLASVVVAPSMSEVFCQVAAEAMSCGTPVVGFNCTGISDVIDHKRSGYLAEPFSTADLANGIAWCLGHNSDGQLSHSAREKVLSQYSVSRVAQQYKQLYEELSRK